MHSHIKVCPVCNGTDLVRTVERPRLPAMQNHIFRSQQQALDSNAGSLCLAICSHCGFGFNDSFDSNLLHYDQDYDNSVASTVTASYYQEIARYLREKYVPDNGVVFDIGCGKGTFLKTMCRLFPDVRGVGVDPSYEGPDNDPEFALRFVRDLFAENQVQERPDLVVCRHVLEHIECPVTFLKSVRAALRAYPDVPVFFEVPDLGWIIKNDAFWDFCYEHCNYFTSASLANAMSLSGFRLIESRAAFGSQYLWIEAITDASSGSLQTTDAVSELIQSVQNYRERELSLMSHARQVLTAARREGRTIVIWGMSTKGILFSCLVDQERTLIDYCVDMNRNKQGCYVPTTGCRIDSPEVLRLSNQEPLLIVVMNPNYLIEIKATCGELGLTATFANANGDAV